MIIRGGKSVAASFHFFGLLPHRSQPSGWTIQLHRCKRYLRWFCLAQIKDIMLGHFVFIPYNGYVVGFSLYLYLRRLNPFPAFSSRNNVGDPSREDRETALMQCMHHLRAASGERSTLHVGLAATTPLFEEETYRKVCRMGRDAPFSAKMNHAHLHQGTILGYPSWHVPMALFLQVSSSLAPMQYTDVCRIAQLPNRGWLLDFGREVFFPRHTCNVERTENLMGASAWLYLFIYIVIVLYSYILIYLYCCCVVYLLCCLFISLLHTWSMGVLLSLYLLYLLGILSLGTVLSLDSLL